jgi:bla regulator protein blaR1
MSTEFMQTWLFDSLLVTTLLMGAILLVRRPVAKMFGPGVAYALWLIPAARLLMPGLEGAPVAAAGDGQWVRDVVRESILSGVPSSNPVTIAANDIQAATIDYAALGVTFWLGGAALFFIIQMIRYASMRDDLLSEAEEIAYLEGVSVVASDQVAGPLAFGLLKRYIAVPQDFTRTYSPAERELALAHEMAHHKSGDLYANLAAFIILCLQWFNPVAWLSWNAFRFDQEAACDARVLAGKGAEERAIYGQALARTAFDGVPTFATALNSPKTIIERLRRLTMKDTSTKRRIFGRIGVIVATAVILPATATIVPAVVAQQNTSTPGESAKTEAVRSHAKVIMVKKGDGETVDVVTHKNSKVHKIERDGRTIVIHSDKELSDADLDKMAADAEKHAADAEKWAEQAREVRGTVDEARIAADVARGMAEVHRVNALKMASSYVPEIDIREIRGNCKEGQPVSTNISGFDGHNKSRVKLVMCGKGQARVARASALEGLREARDDVASDDEIPNNVRKDVVEKLEEQIRKLESQVDKDGNRET